MNYEFGEVTAELRRILKPLIEVAYAQAASFVCGDRDERIEKALVLAVETIQRTFPGTAFTPPSVLEHQRGKKKVHTHEEIFDFELGEDLHDFAAQVQVFRSAVEANGKLYGMSLRLDSGHESLSSEVIFRREETPKEKSRRISLEQKQSRKDATKKAKLEAAELKEYERLQKKFGKKPSNTFPK